MSLVKEGFAFPKLGGAEEDIALYHSQERTDKKKKLALSTPFAPQVRTSLVYAQVRNQQLFFVRHREEGWEFLVDSPLSTWAFSVCLFLFEVKGEGRRGNPWLCLCALSSTALVVESRGLIHD